MRRQAAAQQQLVFIIIGRDAALQLRAMVLEPPPFRHLLEVHVSASGFLTAAFENADRIAAHDRNERTCEPAQSTHTM